jgi:hypothetical protein
MGPHTHLDLSFYLLKGGGALFRYHSGSLFRCHSQRNGLGDGEVIKGGIKCQKCQIPFLVSDVSGIS